MKKYEVKVWEEDGLECWLQFVPGADASDCEIIQIRRFFVDEESRGHAELLERATAASLPGLRATLAAILEDA